MTASFRNFLLYLHLYRQQRLKLIKLKMAGSSSHVAVLGCGVIGLSTAVAILEGQAENARGSRRYVSIVAKEVPDLDDESRKKSADKGQSHSAEYASVWAVSMLSRSDKHRNRPTLTLL